MTIDKWKTGSRRTRRVSGTIAILFFALRAGYSPGAERATFAGSSGAPAWASIGPSPPAIEAPVAVDSATGTIYITSNGGGVLKSTDRGATFETRNTGLPNLAITGMVMDSRDPDHVLVGTAGDGIFLTVDGGAAWTRTSETGSHVVASFLVGDPFDSRIYYAGFLGDPTTAIKKSVDGGVTWFSASKGIAQVTVWWIAADPHNAGTLYVATAEAGAFKTIDGGVSWTALPTQPVVWTLAVDPVDSRVIYAGMNGDGVFQSTDAGASFSRVGSPEAGVVLSLAVDPNDTRYLYAATASGGVERSDDRGRTWKRTSVRQSVALTLTVTDESRVYVGTAFDGVFVSAEDVRRSKDAPEKGDFRIDATHGRRFGQIAVSELRAVRAQNVYSISIDPRDSAHLILATNDGGLLGSSDGGKQWRDVGRGFLSRASRRAFFDPNAPGRVYAGSFKGGGLYASKDNGKSWTRRVFGSPTIYVWATAVDPVSGAIYAGTIGEGLWKSTDQGASFLRIDGSLIRQVRDIAFDSSTPGKILVASLGGLFRSVDGGSSFSKVLPVAISTVTIDPTNASVVYAGTQTLGVYKSLDGGETFVASNTGLTNLQTSRGGGVAIDPSDSSIVFAGTEGGGVFKSRNGGATWVPVNGGLANLKVLGIAIDPANPNVLYAGGPSGVFKTETGGE